MERLVAIGEKSGLPGADLRQFVTDQQTIEREERQKGQKKNGRRSGKGLKRKGRRSGERNDCSGERTTTYLRDKEVRTGGGERIKDTPIRDHTSAANLPKIVPFQDGKDKLDSYLLRFERFARANRWEDELWAGA